MSISGLLRFEFLRGENAKKRWMVLIGILLYMLASIWLSHIAENNAKYMSKLNAENRRLRSEYVSVKSKLMMRQLRSSVYEEIKSDGFILPKRPPYKIIIEE